MFFFTADWRPPRSKTRQFSMIILTAQLSIINLWSHQITRIMPVDIIAIKYNVKLYMTNCNTTILWLLCLFVEIHSRDILVKVMFWQRKQQYFLQQFKIVKYDTGVITGSKVTILYGTDVVISWALNCVAFVHTHVTGGPTHYQCR